MRLIVTLFLLSLVHTQLIAQAPQRISYQAVVRNSSNGLVSSTQVGMRISILQGSASGTAVYAERHTPTTNENGLLTIEIGGGTLESGTFSSIQWANGPFFIKSETDPAGGTSYSITGTTQLLSVPYALYANTAGNGIPPGTQAGQMLYWDGTKWTTLPKGTNGQYLKWCNDTLTWGPCLPVLKTIAVKNVDDHPQATANIAVLSDGGSYITEFGLCVSKSPNPTYPNDHVGSAYSYSQLGLTEIVFGIESNTTYYVRAYAVNSVGVAYGNEISFTAKTFSTPVVLLDSISSIDSSSAILWGTISNTGSAAVNQKGFVWDTVPNVSLNSNNNSYIPVGNNDFSAVILNLKPNKKYYVRAFAGNNYGNSYSAEQSFITDSITVPPPPPPPPPAPTSLSDIDGNVYPVIKIANKHWISKNLDVTHYKNGDSIPQVQDAATWASLTTGAWCYYENQTANGTTYGKLYNWYAMNDPRGIAPEGWHVPTDTDWQSLTDSLGGFAVAGGKLKATTLWDLPNWGATNSSGFSALPGGYRYYNGSFGFKGANGHWWSSTPTQMSADLGTYVWLSNDTPQIFLPHWFEKQYGYAIRLIWNY
jgi:uncharacterized protein (TIGR02145 family)